MYILNWCCPSHFPVAAAHSQLLATVYSNLPHDVRTDRISDGWGCPGHCNGWIHWTSSLTCKHFCCYVSQWAQQDIVSEPNGWIARVQWWIPDTHKLHTRTCYPNWVHRTLSVPNAMGGYCINGCTQGIHCILYRTMIDTRELYTFV